MYHQSIETLNPILFASHKTAIAMYCLMILLLVMQLEPLVVHADEHYQAVIRGDNMLCCMGVTHT